MTNLNQSYNHADYIKCLDVADFAKVYNFKDSSGAILGRNKIFRILRFLKILDRNNVPYQSYTQYFRSMAKEYQQAGNVFKKIIVFITPEGQTYLANKINNYLDDVGEKKEVAGISVCESVKTERSSPLDMDKEQALAWLSSLPDIVKNTYFAVEVRKKWGVDG